MKLNPGTRVLNVKLQPDDIMLSEVVVKPKKEKYSRKNNPYKSNNPDLFLFPMRDGVPTSHVMGKTPYVEASVGIYNIFKLLHIEYVRRLTYTDIPGVKKGGIRFMILMIF